MSLANGLSILFIFSKNQFLALLIFAMVSFVSFAFISALILKIYFGSAELGVGACDAVCADNQEVVGRGA